MAANEALGAALPALRMVRAEQGVTWGWAGDEDALDRMLWPVVFSAAELLIAAQGRPHVRQCAFKDCKLFFARRKRIPSSPASTVISSPESKSTRLRRSASWDATGSVPCQDAPDDRTWASPLPNETRLIVAGTRAFHILR